MAHDSDTRSAQREELSLGIELSELGAQTLRPRHRVPRPLLGLLWPLFRYSATRDAYVLRGVGNRRGPVLRQR